MALDEITTDALITCALRFDGYRYIQVHDRNDEYLSDLTNEVINSLHFHNNTNDNLAVFFGLQRFLYKWGGESLPENSREHFAFRFLFLHLYREDIPQEFQSDEFCQKWRTGFSFNAESYAATIRTELARLILP